MPDLQPLNYNPMQTGLQAYQLLQMQQHLGLATQAQAMQQQNLAIDNARQAYQAANPMESYPAYANYAKLSGLPVPDVNSYYANPNMYDKLLNAEPGTTEHTDAMNTWIKTNPASRAVVEKEVDKLRGFRGAQNLGVQAGLGGDENTASLIQQSVPLQTQVGQALALTPMQKAQAEALQQKITEHNNLTTYTNAQLGALVPITKAADLAISRVAPQVQELAGLQQEYDKNVKSLGLTAAAKAKSERMSLNPGLQAFNDRRQQSIPQLQQQVQRIEDLQNQLQTRAELIANGVQPLAEGESLHLLAGKIDASVQHLAYAKATLAFAQKPTPENFEALKAVNGQLQGRIADLTQAKNTSQQQVDIHRSAQIETARKNAFGEEQDAANALGQRYFAALPTAQQTPQSAAKIAAQVQTQTGKIVATKDIMAGAQLPNNPLVKIDMKQETAEAGVVGSEFGKQYTTLQNTAIQASDKLSKLDRMEQLLKGVSTGKLTPALTQVQAIADSLGISVDKTLPAKQALESLTNEVALGLRNPSGGAGMPGAMSDKDREFLMTMPAGLGKTPEGNRLIIETARALERRSQQVAKMARAYRAKNGHFDEGFLNELQDYSEKHPLFAGKELPTEATVPDIIPGVAPFNDPEKEARYQEFKRTHK